MTSCLLFCSPNLFRNGVCSNRLTHLGSKFFPFGVELFSEKGNKNSFDKVTSLESAVISLITLIIRMPLFLAVEIPKFEQASLTPYIVFSIRFQYFGAPGG